MTNQEIIEQLKNSNSNASDIRELLPQWDKSEPFPVDELEVCIKMHQWKREDFDFEMELLVKEYLPAFMLDVFFDVKEFRSNIRNEVSTTCAGFCKIQGYPMQTQDDKAFCQFKYSFMKYYMDSKLKINNN